MFEEPGRKIKTLAVIVFVLGVIGSLFLAFTFGRDRWGDISVMSFLIICLTGAISSYISSLLVYGVGGAIEDISVLRQQLFVISKKMDDAGNKETASSGNVVSPTNKTVQTSTGSFNLSDYI